MELPDPLSSYVSTGNLPPSDQVACLVAEAHQRKVALGKSSQVYPALARVPAGLFGICFVDVGGRAFSIGDAEHDFSIMSVSKPFIVALVCDVIGATGARERLGVNATGYAFNSLTGIERSPEGRTNPMVNAGAIVSQRSLVTLLFNVLATSSPKELAGDVGSLRGTTDNRASAVGTAVAGALLVTLLSTAVMRQLADNPTLPVEIQSEVNPDSITFVNDERLQSVIAGTSATAEQKAEALRIDTESRLRALKIGFLIMAGLALLTILPAGRLRNHRPGEIPEG